MAIDSSSSSIERSSSGLRLGFLIERESLFQSLSLYQESLFLESLLESLLESRIKAVRLAQCVPPLETHKNAAVFLVKYRSLCVILTRFVCEHTEQERRSSWPSIFFLGHHRLECNTACKQWIPNLQWHSVHCVQPHSERVFHFYGSLSLSLFRSSDVLIQQTLHTQSITDRYSLSN